MSNRRAFLLHLSAAALPALAAPKLPREYLVFIGTSTGRKSQGIYVFRFDPNTGETTRAELAAEANNPNFLEIHPSRKFLHAVGNIPAPDGKTQGGVMAYALDPASGRLALLNQVSSQGAGPCHISIDRTGRCAVVANYGGGTVASLPIGKDGRLGEAASVIQHTGSSANPQRQEKPHPHSFNISPDNRWAVAADLGTDEVRVYRLDAARATITPNTPSGARVAPGSGPRHFAFHPSGKYGYVINELANTVTGFSFDARSGVFTEIQTIPTLPAGYTATSYTAEVRIHPNGRFLYGSNRGHDSLAVFAINPASGELSPIQTISTQGKFPRNFNLDPSGLWLLAANQDTDNVVVYRVDPASGMLAPTGNQVEAPTPICVRFVPAR